MLFRANLKYFLVFTLLFCSSLLAQNNFEGKVVMRIGGDQAADMDYFIKENKMRMEMKSEEGKLIILHDQKDSKTYMVMPEQKMYMEFSGIDYMAEMKSDDKSPNINRTGEFKDIKGYKCEKWIVEDEENIVEAWMTDELGNFYMMSNPMGGMQDKWQKELQGNFFPLKVDIIESGEKKTTMEVISVSKMSLNADLFSVPKGFQKLDMPGMNMNKQN